MGPKRQSTKRPSEGCTPRARKGDSAQRSSGGEVRNFLAKNENPLEWATPTGGESDLEIRAWTIWEYSRELYSREPFAALCTKKSDREKCDAVFNINHAVFGTNAAAIIWRRLDTPWNDLEPIERERMIRFLIAGAEAFTASLEREAPCAFENGQLRHNFQSLFVDLPRGVDVIRGRFAIDRAKGKERIMKEFGQWLEKTCKVKGRGRGRIDEPEAWLRQLACLRYVTARGNREVEIEGERNRMIKDQSAPLRSFDHLKANARKAKKILAENEAIAQRILRESA